MPIGMERKELRHDWEYGSYIDGGILEGRIDWDRLDELEKQSLEICERVCDQFDTVVVHFSGGIDIIVITHMLDQLDVDVQLVNFRSCEDYPSSVDFMAGMANAFDFPLDEVVLQTNDIQWVKENSDEMLWPTFEVKDMLYSQSYRNPSHRYHVENDVDAFITGRRNEHNITPKTVVPDKEAYNSVNPFPEIDEMVAYQVNPINTWSIDFVLAYHDKYSIPIMPGYRFDEGGCAYAWHRAARDAPWVDYKKSDVQMWWECRQMTVRYGYTNFWQNHITEYFPEAETKASEYALETDTPMLSVHDGYNYGADTEPVPYPVGPVSEQEVVSNGS